MLQGTYNPKDVIFTVGNHRVTGVADGTFLKITYIEPDNYKMRTGAFGDVTRTKTNNPAGLIEVTLSQDSPSNARFDLIALQPATIPSSVVNKSDGRYIAIAGETFIMRFPDDEFADDVTNRVWIVGCADLKKTNLVT